MNDERNFRSQYYEKVGCKGVEEKKSLEILFKGVIPAQKNCYEFIMKERTQQYQDLLSGLKAINFVTVDAPKEQQFLHMWLLEKYKLMHDKNAQLDTELHQNLLAITKTLIGIFESDVDVYWIAKGLFDYVKSWYSSIPQLIETTKSILQKEDTTLYCHLTENDLLNKIPMDTWFGRCFAGVLHDNALVKVWDKMIGSSFRVLVFVCSVLLSKMRRVLLTCVNITDILHCVQSVTNETADVIVSRSLEMWQTQGRTVIYSPIKDHKTTPQNRKIKALYKKS